jgi:superfamily II DNA helicase RecQ
VIERGIVLIFIPLLTLSADVMHKFEAYNPTWGKVGVYHLDDTMYDCDRQLYSSFLRSCSSMRQDTSSTFFVFLSPQSLINHRDALDVFVACAHDQTLRVIAMDEAHIHVQHGTSFREEIRALRIEFFKKIFGNQPRDLHPRMIALTATLPTTYVGLLSNLLTADMSIGDSILRGSPEDFRQREITMKMDICSKKAQFVSKGLVVVAEFLQANPHCSAIVFCNSRKQSQEKKLDHMRLSVDIININGSLDKIDKFWRIRLFCDN